MSESHRLREVFLKCLTVDSETKDGRRKGYNQAIFMPERTGSLQWHGLVHGYGKVRQSFERGGNMKKIISLYQRNYDGDFLVRDEVVPGAEWVFDGVGIPTRKYDGTCVKIEDGVMWKRHELNKGKKPPEGFVPATDADPITGKQQGWLPVGEGPDDRWYREALLDNDATPGDFGDGTFELIGPKVQGNHERIDYHTLIQHGAEHLPSFPLTFDGIREFLREADIEGIVWHHPDGRMVKIKTKDFGLSRGLSR